MELMQDRPPTGSIPDAPGSYQFYDAEGRVLYVGKAKSLRHRLPNYWQDSAMKWTPQKTMNSASVTPAAVRESPKESPRASAQRMTSSRW